MTRLVKRTYSIPGAVAEDFERSVPVGKRSEVLAQLMRDWIDRRKREALRENVVAGCLEMADIQLETEQEFRRLEEEVVHKS